MIAVLENGIVTAIVEEYEGTNQSVDISGLNPQPGVGWRLDGNVLNDGSLDLRIFRYFDALGRDKKSPPMDVDFITGLNTKLHRKCSIVKGEIKSEEFFAYYDGVTYSVPVVKETHVFTRDSLGFAKSRTTTVEWYMECGLLSEKKKSWVKYYDPLQMIEEGIDRRGNIVKFLQPAILQVLFSSVQPSEYGNVVLWGRALLNELSDEFNNFVDHSDKTIYTAIASQPILDAHPWLLNQIPGAGINILQYILSEMAI